MSRVEARVIEVIQVSTVEGVGTAENPHRPVIYYFFKDGRLAARYDQWEAEGRPPV